MDVHLIRHTHTHRERKTCMQTDKYGGRKTGRLRNMTDKYEQLLTDMHVPYICT